MNIDLVIFFLIFSLFFYLVPYNAWADDVPDFSEPVETSEAPEVVTLPEDIDQAETTEAPVYVVVSEEPTAPVYMSVLQDTESAIVHSNLFGAFLICGTLWYFAFMGGFVLIGFDTLRITHYWRFVNSFSGGYRFAKSRSFVTLAFSAS